MFDHRQAPTKYLVAMIAAALLFHVAPVHAQDTHGVIAIGWTAQGQSVVYGLAWNYAARDEALQAAMNACRTSGGGNCVELAKFQNGCDTLAVDQHSMAQGKSAVSREQAEVLAAVESAISRQPSSTEKVKRAGSANKVLYFAKAEPKCTKMPEGSSCWKEISNKPGCFVFNLNNIAYEIVTWSGGCLRDIAHGNGTLRWISPESDQKNTGKIVHGKLQGHWVVRMGDGTVAKGPVVDNNPNGHWVIRDANGGVDEGPYVDGKRNGHWVIRDANGGVEAGPFVDGKKNGLWITRYKDGSRLEIEWRHGSYEGQPGVVVTPKGKRHLGKWSDGCLIDQKGRPIVKSSEQTWKGCRNR